MIDTNLAAILGASSLVGVGYLLVRAGRWGKKIDPLDVEIANTDWLAVDRIIARSAHRRYLIKEIAQLKKSKKRSSHLQEQLKALTNEELSIPPGASPARTQERSPTSQSLLEEGA